MALFGFFTSSKAPIEPTIPATTTENNEHRDPATTNLTVKRKRYGGDHLGETIFIDVGGADGSEIARFDAHKRKFCKASTFFARKFLDDSSVDLQVVELPDEEPAIFNQIQHWVYDGSLLDLADNASRASQQPLLTNALSEERADHVKRVKLDAKAAEEDTDDENNTDVGEEVENENHNLNFDHEGVERQDTRLDTLSLTKIYVLAETLGMPKLCNEVISQLVQELDPSNGVPMKELLYAYRRSAPASKVRSLLIDFVAGTQDAMDLNFLTGYELEASKQLLQDLVFALAPLRAEVREDYVVDAHEEGSYEIDE